ncbi:MAG TPA: class I SAM-dependent methyltransferase [Silvibacterium sp.]|nr:class I SAM-dependent methyltransferase [Silvibacterium sp.]
MLEHLLPVTKEYPESTWLTVGDGKFGSDAFFLQDHVADVVATSISAYTLEIAHSKGFIKKYAAENAEAFSLSDNAVDFVLCKESFHHFPRPALGFYEMLRIARKGVALIEPIEGSGKPLALLKSFVKKTLRHDITEEFEPSGNFLYRLSIRETEKMLIALEHRCLAWKGINDFWYPPFGSADANHLSLGLVGTRFGIGAQNMLAGARLLNYGLAVVFCFKEDPSPQLRSTLRKSGFAVIDLPVNPYLRERPVPVQTNQGKASSGTARLSQEQEALRSARETG